MSCNIKMYFVESNNSIKNTFFFYLTPYINRIIPFCTVVNFIKLSVVVVGFKVNCPLVGPGPIGGMPTVGGLSKGS